ncbi:hypothetical protein [Yoonia maritima]|uniref:hypothetical protein n=1 Tax=Yoonia maritima TaxID=1435347 RepID=UPI000D0F4019|nr:hypothetical protein [Yoonia maritima]
MTIEFVKSARRIALEKFMILLIALIVGAAFAFVLLGDISDEIIVNTASTIAAIISVFIAIAILIDIKKVLMDGRDWRVVVSDEMLSWESPVPEMMKPIKLALKDIDRTRFTLTHFKYGKRAPDKKWEIILRNGFPIKIDGHASGINPHKVFAALETKGITFEQVSESKGAAVRTSGQN